MKNITDRERVTLAAEVYNLVFKNTASFESEDNIGADLAYLLGAIVGATDKVDWTEENCGKRPALYLILRDALPAHHGVWSFIQL